MKSFLKKLAVLCLLVLIAKTARASSLSASDIVSRARTYLKDQQTSANRQQFSDVTLYQFLSDGQREANAQNWLLQSSYTFTLIKGTTEYAMPIDFMAVWRLWFQPQGSSFLKMQGTSMDELDAQVSGWVSATGIPTKYYVDRSSGTVYLGFFPAPSVNLSTGPVILYYIQQSTDIASSSPSSLPFNGWTVLQPYSTALADYVTYRGYLTLEEIDIANVYLQRWLAFLQIMRQGLYKTPDFQPGFAGQRGP